MTENNLSTKLDLSRDPFFDFLRGLALILVLFNHIYSDQFTNGKHGIDLFFLISGYLITQSLLLGQDSKLSQVIHFSQKRIVRILPGFLSLQIFVFILAYFVLTSEEAKNLFPISQSFHLFYSNFKMATLFGYFDAPAKLQFYTHTWSLSVEEQYYFLWIFTFIAVNFSKNRLYLAVLIYLSCSLVYFQFFPGKTMTDHHWDSFSRLWIFCLGALLFFIKERYLARSKNSFNKPYINLALVVYILSLLVLIVIQPMSQYLFVFAFVLAIFWQTLATNKNNLVSQLSRKSLFNFFGQISYPVYICFHPLSVTVLYLTGAKSQLVTMFIVLVSIAIGIIFHFKVEKWFMHPADRHKKVFGLLTAWVVILFWIFINIISDKPLFNTLITTRTENIKTGYVDERYPSTVCPFAALQSQSKEKCVYYSSHEFNRRVVVWTDSSGISLIPDLIEGFHERAQDITVISTPGCPTLKNTDYIRHIQDRCRNGFSAKEIVEHIKLLKPDTIIMMTNWSLFWTVDFMNKNKGVALYDSALVLSEHKKSLQSTIDEFKNTRIMLSTIGPQFEEHVVQYFPRKQVYVGTFDSLEIPLQVYKDRNDDFNRMTYEFSHQHQVSVVDLQHLFCDELVCKGMKNNELYYKDVVHWTPLGSKKVVEEILKQFDQQK